MTSTVKAGQASSRGARRNSQEKVAANKAAVDKLNEPTPPTRLELIAEAKSLGVKGADRMKRDEVEAAIAAAKSSTPEPEAKAEPERSPEQETLYIATKARDEFKALQAWEQGGKKGARPDTANYDKLQAQYAAGGSKAKKRGSGKGRSSKLGPRGQAGSAAMKERGGRRGRGKKLTHDELVKHLAAALKAHPDTTALDELYHAHWIDGIAVSKDRLFTAFDEAKKGAAKKAA